MNDGRRVNSRHQEIRAWGGIIKRMLSEGHHDPSNAKVCWRFSFPPCLMKQPPPPRIHSPGMNVCGAAYTFTV